MVSLLSLAVARQVPVTLSLPEKLSVLAPSNEWRELLVRTDCCIQQVDQCCFGCVQRRRTRLVTWNFLITPQRFVCPNHGGLCDVSDKIHVTRSVSGTVRAFCAWIIKQHYWFREQLQFSILRRVARSGSLRSQLEGEGPDTR